MFCNKCGTELEKKAKKCPSCGEKVKSGCLKKILIAMLVIIVGFVAIIMLAPTSDPPYSEALAAAQSMPEDEFAEKCSSVDIQELRRDPDSRIGDYVYVNVEVDVYIGDKDMACATYSEEYDGYLGDDIVISDMRSAGDNIIEGDIIDAYGVFLGTVDVETVLGQTKTVPHIGMILAELSTHPAEATSSAEEATPESDDNIISVEIDHCQVDYIRYEIVQNDSDETCLAIFYEFTNNSTENKSFDFSIDDIAFQNGVELETSFWHVNDESNASGLEIQPGTTLTVCSAFVLRDASAVEIQVSDWNAWDEEILDSMMLTFE